MSNSSKTSFINYLPSNSLTLGQTVTLNGHIKTNIERELQRLLAKATYFVNTEVTRKRRACASHKTGGRSQNYPRWYRRLADMPVPNLDTVRPGHANKAVEAGVHTSFVHSSIIRITPLRDAACAIIWFCVISFRGVRVVS